VSDVSWIPATALARELGVNRRTIGRWAASQDFPAPKSFHRRLYFRRDEIDAWKESRGSAVVSKSGVQTRPGASRTLQDIPENELASCGED
jgi:predicted DNA-binding transcriptional regulator AlpA